MAPSDPLIRALDPITRRVRTDITAIKSATTGQMSWRRDEPLDDERLAHHLNGGPYRGVCPINEGEDTAALGLLDFDSHRGEIDWAQMSRVVLDVIETLELLGGAPIAFRSSGGHGVHLYLLWDTKQDARSVREWLRGALGACGLKAGTRGVKHREVEIFPKQDSVKLGGCGSQFILALAGESVPLAIDEAARLLVPVARETLVGQDWGQASWDVPVLPAPVLGGLPSKTNVGDGFAWRQALDAIGNGRDGSEPLSYDDWRNVIFAIYEETGGSDEGLALAQEWSARAEGKHDGGAFLEQRVWPYVRMGGGITGRTIMSMASRLAGWHGSGLDPSVMAALDGPDDGAVSGGAVGAIGAQVTSAQPLSLPQYSRDNRGMILAEMRNAVMAVDRPDICGFRIAYDEFKDEIVIFEGEDGDSPKWRAITDADLVSIRIELEKAGFKSAPKEMARDAVVLVAAKRRFDSAILWLNGLQWDGVCRIETFLVDYFGAADTVYTRAVGKYLWTALAGRVMDPGCQVDMVPVLEGKEGLRKSTTIAAIAPAYDQFVEVDLGLSEEKMARLMRGVLVGEIAELRGLGTKDEEAIKKFITRQREKWIPKFREFSTTFPRRLVMIGTTNPKTEGYLKAGEVNRRWLPVEVGKADAEGVKRDRLLLWAEARDAWRSGGVQWETAEGLGGAEREQHVWRDEWEEVIRGWLATAQEGRFKPVLTVGEVGAAALGIPARDLSMPIQHRIGRALRALGYAKVVRRDAEGRQGKVWLLPRV